MDSSYAWVWQGNEEPLVKRPYPPQMPEEPNLFANRSRNHAPGESS